MNYSNINGMFILFIQDKLWPNCLGHRLMMIDCQDEFDILYSLLPYVFLLLKIL